MARLYLGHLSLDIDDSGKCEERLVWGTQMKLMICIYYMWILFVDRMKLPFIILKSSFFSFFLQIVFIVLRLLKSDLQRFQNGELYHVWLWFLLYKSIYGIILDFVDCGLYIISKACVYLWWKHLNCAYMMWIVDYG